MNIPDAPWIGFPPDWNDERDEDDDFVGYCSMCGTPLYDTDDYYCIDGEYLCETCAANEGVEDA